MKKILPLALLASLPLFASSVNLDKLIVTTATKSPQALQHITSNVDVITAQEIEERRYHSLSDALRTHAGISLSQNGGLGKTTSVFVRGFDSKRVLVLVDGVRYNDPTSLSGAWFQHIMMGNIERIEIVKGAQSGIWGADASAGVIHIITKKAKEDDFDLALHAEYGSFNTQTYGFNSSYKKGMFELSLNAQRLTSDHFSAKLPKGSSLDDLEDDAYENNSADIKVALHVTKEDTLESFFNYIDSDSDYDGYNKDPLQAANDPKSNEALTQKLYGLSYKRDTQTYQAKLYAQRSDFSREHFSAFSSTPYDGQSDELGLNGTVNYAYDGTLTGGVDYKKFTHTLDTSSVFGVHDYHDKSTQNRGIFLSNNNRFDLIDDDKTTFSQALRYDSFDAFDNKLTYKIGLKHEFGNIQGLWSSINYASGYNIPSLYQLYAPKSGNPSLNPEETQSFDITASYQGFSLSYFHNSIKELIDYQTDPVTFAGGYFNIAGKSKLKGIELGYQNTLRDTALSYQVNYTYLSAKDTNGKKLARRPTESANLSLDYDGIPNAHIGTQLSYVGKRPKSPYDTNPKVDYKAYTLLDIIADYDLSSQLNLYAKINNALDKTYQSVTGYATAQRAYYVGIHYKLK